MARSRGRDGPRDQAWWLAGTGRGRRSADRKSRFKVLYEAVTQLSIKRGVFPPNGRPPTIPEYLRQAGIQQVQQRPIKLGLDRQGRFDPRQQRLLQADVLSAYAGLEAFFVRLGILSPERFQGALAAARAELPLVGICMPMTCSFGLKP